MSMSANQDQLIAQHTHQFLDRTLPKHEWTHKGHFAAALWLLRHRPEHAEPEQMRSLISSYNLATGTANTDVSGYHHTITVASLRAASHHLSAYDAATALSQILDDLVRGPFGRSEWLLSYWRKTTLFSPVARQNWVEPDLQPMPF